VVTAEFNGAITCIERLIGLGLSLYLSSVGFVVQKYTDTMQDKPGAKYHPPQTFSHACMHYNAWRRSAYHQGKKEISRSKGLTWKECECGTVPCELPQQREKLEPKRSEVEGCTAATTDGGALQYFLHMTVKSAVCAL
jgi:hypothetical protein